MIGRTMPSCPRLVVAAAAAALGSLCPERARADEAETAAKVTVAPLPPPPSGQPFLEYGVAVVAEFVAAPGPACGPNAPACVLGSGGGVVVRGGWRPTERWYFGLAYEMTKQDPHELYRLALLQQARAEVRYYVPTGRATAPFFLAGVGVTGYGGQWWPLDTWGPSASVGVGLEVQLGKGVLDVSVAYRPTYLRSWEDSSTLFHDSGIAHFLTFEAAVEQLDAL